MNINRILNELRSEKDRIDKAIAALEAVGRSGEDASRKDNRGTRPKRRLSAAGRRRISQAVKKRWLDARKKKTA